MPEYMTELGYEAGRLSPDDIIDAANKAGKRAFGIDGIVKFFFRPYVYLDDEKLDAAKIDKTEAEGTVAAAIVGVDGVAYAVPRRGLACPGVLPGPRAGPPPTPTPPGPATSTSPRTPIGSSSTRAPSP